MIAALLTAARSTVVCRRSMPPFNAVRRRPITPAADAEQRHGVTLGVLPGRDRLAVVRRAAGRTQVPGRARLRSPAARSRWAAHRMSPRARARGEIRPLKPINRHDTPSQSGRGAKGRRS